jgi:pilus assembly protein CpaB
MRPKSLILIIIAVGCGLIAATGISQVIDRRSQSSSGTVKTNDIFVTLVDIPIGKPLTPQMIKLEPWPTDRIPVGAITRLEDIEGRRPKQPLYAGEPILHRKLIDKDGLGGAAEKIPKGFRVCSVKVTMDSAASGLILPGDRVDVLVFLKKGQGISQPMTKTILTDVIVFAVNERIDRDVEGDGSVIQAKTVSLLVKPDQAEKLALAEELGHLTLSLRRADDDTDMESEGASLEDLHTQEQVGFSTDRNSSEPAPQDSLLGLLDSMKTPSQAVVAAPAVPMTTMEIYSPDGVSTYTWDDPNRLPRELSGSDVGSFGGMGPAAGPAVGIPTDDAPQPEPEDDGELELDDGDL